MPFVDNHVDPLDLAKEWSLLDDVFVGSEADLEVHGPEPGIGLLSSNRRALEDDEADGRCPALKLHLPVGECREGDNDDEGTGLAFLFDKVAEEGDGLDGFTETL